MLFMQRLRRRCCTPCQQMCSSSTRRRSRACLTWCPRSWPPFLARSTSKWCSFCASAFCPRSQVPYSPPPLLSATPLSSCTVHASRYRIPYSVRVPVPATGAQASTWPSARSTCRSRSRPSWALCSSTCGSPVCTWARAFSSSRSSSAHLSAPPPVSTCHHSPFLCPAVRRTARAGARKRTLPQAIRALGTASALCSLRSATYQLRMPSTQRIPAHRALTCAVLCVGPARGCRVRAVGGARHCRLPHVLLLARAAPDAQRSAPHSRATAPYALLSTHYS